MKKYLNIGPYGQYSVPSFQHKYPIIKVLVIYYDVHNYPLYKFIYWLNSFDITYSKATVTI